MLAIVSVVVVGTLLVVGALLGSTWVLQGISRVGRLTAAERRELNEEWRALWEARAALSTCATCPFAARPDHEARAERHWRYGGQAS